MQHRIPGSLQSEIICITADFILRIIYVRSMRLPRNEHVHYSDSEYVIQLSLDTYFMLHLPTTSKYINILGELLWRWIQTRKLEGENINMYQKVPYFVILLSLIKHCFVKYIKRVHSNKSVDIVVIYSQEMIKMYKMKMTIFASHVVLSCYHPSWYHFTY